jgi:ABC-type branched-subunit amino acid transport system substrate-binding protein
MVDALIEKAGLRPEEIAFFTQRDAFGDAGFVGGVAALKRHGLTDEHAIAHGRYERNTLAVENGLADILQKDPPVRAVIMVGAYAPCAEFIRLAREFELDAIFLNVSFVGAAPLAAKLGEVGEGVIVTQVVPHYEADLPIVKQYGAALQAFDSKQPRSFGSLEGYVAARILCRALELIEGPPSREAVIDALEHLGSFDLGLGGPLRLSADEHQASHRVWPTVLLRGKAVPFAWDEFEASESGIRKP